MKPNALPRVLVPAALAFLGASCFQATGNGGTSTGGTAGTETTGGTSGGTSGSSSGGGTTGGSSSGGGSSTGGTLGVGSACTETIGLGGITDPCAAVGLVCQTGGTSLSGTCQEPGTGQKCTPDAGCQSGNVCTGTGHGATCTQMCNQTSDCSSVSSVCSTDAGLCGTDGCTDIGGSCNVEGQGDGTCLNVGGNGSGVCFQNGTATTYSACSGTRQGSSSSTLCQAGDFCVSYSGVGLCYAVCQTGTGHGGGPSDAGVAGDGGSDAGAPTGCATGESCLPLGMLAALAGGGLGPTPNVCAVTNCGQSNACPSGQTCYTLPVSVNGVSSVCFP
ncbi:MAG TPA: hypothetical protein VMB50_15720 [Myxococcales bacterium]|nr:hypothetical protein [Myxococcales bacterium]